VDRRGITDYYDDLLVHRAGLSSRKGISRVSKQLADLHDAPGRAVQPLADASFDTWIKFYRPDENTPTAGQPLRQGRWSPSCSTRDPRRDRRRGELDDVMRLATAVGARARLRRARLPRRRREGRERRPRGSPDRRHRR
jgi:hypothetical protein